MRIDDAHRPAPEQIARLLTATEAFSRYPGLYYQKLYLLIQRGLIHPVQPHGRILYPEWELDAVLKGRYLWRSEFIKSVEAAA